MKYDEEMAKRAIRVNSAYKKVFSTDEGQTVLQDLMTSFGFFGTCFVQGDSHQTAFNEGARSAVLRIIDTFNIDIEDYMKMMETVNQEVFDEA